MMRYYLDRESGTMIPVPGFIDIATGLMVQRFEPREGEIPCDGRTVSRGDYPKLWELFEKAGVLRQRGDTEFLIPDIRAVAR